MIVDKYLLLEIYLLNLSGIQRVSCGDTNICYEQMRVPIFLLQIVDVLMYIKQKLKFVELLNFVYQR